MRQRGSVLIEFTFEPELLGRSIPGNLTVQSYLYLYAELEQPVRAGERHSALEPMWSSDEDAHAALQRVGRDPRFVRRADVLSAHDDGGLDALTSVAGDAFGVEHVMGITEE